jgi:hypothetical protein
VTYVGNNFNTPLDVRSNVDSVKVELQRLVPEVQAALEQVMATDAQRLQDRARALAQGPSVREITGRFVGSIKFSTSSTPTHVTAKVYSDDPRAGLFDFGGTMAARDILPNVKQALRFAAGLGHVYAAIVHRPEIDYAPHPVIHAAFNEMRDGIVKDISDGSRSAIVKLGWSGA